MSKCFSKMDMEYIERVQTKFGKLVAVDDSKKSNIENLNFYKRKQISDFSERYSTKPFA